MKGFQDQVLSWNGAEYTLTARGIMPLVAEVEDILTGSSGQTAGQVLMSRRASPSRVSMAYAAMLRWAGCEVSDEEVYLSMQDDLAEGRSDYLSTYMTATAALLEIVSPPMSEKLARLMEEAESGDADNDEAPEKKQ